MFQMAFMSLSNAYSSQLHSPARISRANAIAEAVSRWLATAAARVRTGVWQVGFVVDKVASGQVFSEYFGFPCQNRSFHQLHHSHNHLGQVQ
jgi:hypothetical protein